MILGVELAGLVLGGVGGGFPAGFVVPVSGDLVDVEAGNSFFGGEMEGVLFREKKIFKDKVQSLKS